MAFSLTSDAFADGGSIPARFTCDGDDVSPALKWQGGPDGTQSFALIMNDPDAPGGTYTHWVIYNISNQASGLTEGVEKTDRPANGEGAAQGSNDFGDNGYGGPCPPGGNAHHYNFRLYALDAMLNLDPGASKEDLLKAMEGRILGETALTGTYKRQ
ncbi:MAG: YbhB/YbcL family Raf kinase inhibitor-like protein [Chloroflexi bacterium]|nr:MAG: YbhB/YbcL family Raf kinase inhibitor-like protein [Chloroflexota bacterium]